MKQETERTIPGSALLAKAGAKRPSLLEKNLMSQRAANKSAFKSQLQSPTKVKRAAGGKQDSEDEAEAKPNDLDDFDSKHLRPHKKGERGQETTRSAIRALNQPSLLRERAVQSIQQHVDRIQTGSSLETVNRNQGALAALT